MFKMQTVNGWSTFKELAPRPRLPYTIVVGRGARARKSVREFDCDDDAIRRGLLLVRHSSAAGGAGLPWPAATRQAADGNPHARQIAPPTSSADIRAATRHATG